MRRIAVGYLGATTLLCGPSYFAWFRKPFDVGSLEFDPWLGLLSNRLPAQAAHVVLFVVCSVLYVTMVRSEQPLPRWLVPATWSAYLLAVPWVSPDVFFYLSKGWLQLHYGLSPYTAAVGDVAGYMHDPLFSSMVPGLRNQLGNYGPLFQRLCLAVVYIARGSPAVGLIVFKIVSAASLLGCYLLIRRIANQVGHHGRTNSRLFLLNPLLLFNFLGAAHNDSLLMLAILCGVMLSMSEHLFIAGIALGISVSFKLVGVFLVPVIAVYVFLRYPRASVLRYVFVLISGVALGIVGGISVDPASTGYFGSVLRYDAQVFRSSVHLLAAPMLSAVGSPLGLDSLVWGKIAFCGLASAGIAWNAFRLRDKPGAFLVLSCFEVLILAQFLVLPSMNEWYLLWPFCFALCSPDAPSKDWLLQLSLVYMPLVIFAVVGSPLVVVRAQLAILSALSLALVLYSREKFRAGTSP